MYRDYGSPVFPLFNSIFHSPDYLRVDFRDPRWAIKSPVDLVTLPFRWLTSSRRTSEVSMRDWRWFMFLALSAIWATLRVVSALQKRHPPVRKRSEEKPVGTQLPSVLDPTARRFMITLIAAGLPLTLLQLAYTRYLVIGELLAGVSFVALAEVTFAWRPHRIRLAVVIVAVVLAFSSTTQNWGSVPLGESWYRVALHDPPQNSMILVIGEGAYQYVLPYFPSSDRFGAIGDGNSQFVGAYGRFASEMRTFYGDVFLLSPVSQESKLRLSAVGDLQSFGLTFAPDGCSNVGSVTGNLWLCRLTRPPMSPMSKRPSG
jgi:hypothetical protein